MNANTFVAVARFFSLAECAARNGGFWVSAAGGTANIVAGEISRATACSYSQAHEALDCIGKELHGEDWYACLADMQPWPALNPPEDGGRWDARTIARAACR